VSAVLGKMCGGLVCHVAVLAIFLFTASSAASLSAQSFYYGDFDPMNSGASVNGAPMMHGATANAVPAWTNGAGIGTQPYTDLQQHAAAQTGPVFMQPVSDVTSNAASQLWQDVTPQQSFGLSGPVVQSQLPQRQTHSDRRTYVGVEAIYLVRDGLSPADFVFDDNGASLNFSDLDAGSSFDGRLRWSRVDGTGKGYEFVVLKSDGFSSRNIVNGPNVVPIFFNSVPSEPVDTYEVQYDSSLETYELNYWGGSRPNLRFGVGGRFINLREEFDILSTPSQVTAPTGGNFSDTDNDLFGVQFLAEFRKWISRSTVLEAGSRTGIYNNNIDVRAFASNGQLHRETNLFSFVGNWNAGLRFHNSLGYWRVGYEAIYLTNVAVAPDQSETLSLFNTSANEIVAGDAFYHGVYAGFELMF